VRGSAPCRPQVGDDTIARATESGPHQSVARPEERRATLL
jgi:hypothetical protein